MLVATVEQSGKCSQIAATAITVEHHKNAEHFAFQGIGMPRVVALHGKAHLFCRHHTKRVRAIGEGVIETRGQEYSCRSVLEYMEFIFLQLSVYLAVMWKQACFTSCFT